MTPLAQQFEPTPRLYSEDDRNVPPYVRRYALHTKAVSTEGWLRSYLHYRDRLVGHENRHIRVIVEDGEAVTYYRQDELERSNQIGRAFYGDGPAVDAYLESAHNACERHVEHCRRVYEADYANLARSRVASLFDEYVSRYIDCLAYYKLSAEEFCVAVGRDLREGLQPFVPDVNAALQVLLAHDPTSLQSFQEREAWLKLLEDHGLSPRSDAVRERLEAHRRRFGFLGAHGGTPQGWDADYLRDRFEAAHRHRRRSVAELRRAVESDRASAGRGAALSERLPSGLRDLLQRVARSAHLRMQIREVFTLGAFLSNPLFEHVFALLRGDSGREVDTEVCRQLGIDETRAVLDGRSVDVDRLHAKREASAYLLDLAAIEVVVGPEALALRPSKGGADAGHTAQGMVAFAKGVVRGRAFLINPGDHTREKLRTASEMQEGDILVTGMTHPNIVVACERAAAIVTDEGGVACHAAIVAREFRIPCVVGRRRRRRYSRRASSWKSTRSAASSERSRTDPAVPLLRPDSSA